jgi:ribonuclease PH
VVFFDKLNTTLNDSILIIANFSGGKEEIILVEMKNLLHRNHLNELLKMGIDACAQIHACIETAVFQNVKAAHRL